MRRNASKSSVSWQLHDGIPGTENSALQHQQDAEPRKDHRWVPAHIVRRVTCPKIGEFAQSIRTPYMMMQADCPLRPEMDGPTQ